MLPKLPSFRLDGKTALVTGGGRGIGLAAAAALAQAGATVTLAARTSGELEVACEGINAAGGKSNFIVLDATDSAAVTEAVASHGPFNVLVNSAGMNRPTELINVKDEDIDSIFAVNVKAAFYLSRAIAKGLIEAKQPGSIINISSLMGHVGSPGRTVYCASKHAVEGLTKALAWELGAHGIRVNTLCPTFVETAFTSESLKSATFREWVTSRIALGRLGRVEDMMGGIVFLASDASSIMTGTALMLDGGWTAV
jgi:NAD(P)-dependent dehydrogenase (short-subunit alcohol dehydrogenase family)